MEAGMRRLAVVLSSVGLLATVSFASAGAAHAGTGPRLFGPTSHPYGASYPVWASRWSQWAFGTPIRRNPLANLADCDVAQHAPVFYLPAPSAPDGTTTCTVPAGEAVLVAPAGNIVTPNHGGGRIAKLLASAQADTDALTNISASLDGTPLPVQDFRTASPFVLFLPKNNLLGGASGPTLAAIDGYFVMLKPLAVGTHTVTTSDTFPDGSTADISITLEVVSRHQG
jgi:hypothetical protein